MRFSRKLLHGLAKRVIQKAQGYLTDAEYMSVKGKCCPFCKSGDVLETPLRNVDDHDDFQLADQESNFALYARHAIRCVECHKQFYDVYKIVGWCEKDDQIMTNLEWSS